MSKIKLIASDMDGTFLYDGQTVSPANQKALWDAWEAGIHLAFCSGRGPKNIQALVKSYKLPPCYLLGYNGTYCLDTKGELLWVNYVDPGAVARCKAVFDEEKLVFGLMAANRLALNRDPDDKEAANCGSMSFAKEEWSELTWDPNNFSKGLEEGVCKLLYIDRREGDHIEKIRSKIEKISEINIMSSWHDNFEMMPKGVNKGTAVGKVANLLNITWDEVMTLGDQENDVEMLRHAGYGVAVANAAPKALAAAKYQTGHHRDDGVAQAIYRYALNNL